MRPVRLTRRAQFLRCAAAGRKVATTGMVVQALPHPAPGGPVGLGFTVTKKVGNAVVRNRVRRRLREAARLALAERPASGCDLVLIGREGSIARSFRDLRADLDRALARLAVARLDAEHAPPAPAEARA